MPDISYYAPFVLNLRRVGDLVYIDHEDFVAETPYRVVAGPMGADKYCPRYKVVLADRTIVMEPREVLHSWLLTPLAAAHIRVEAELEDEKAEALSRNETSTLDLASKASEVVEALEDAPAIQEAPAATQAPYLPAIEHGFDVEDADVTDPVPTVETTSEPAPLRVFDVYEYEAPMGGHVPKGTLYLSGPMTGIPDFNRPAFMEAEEVIMDMGYEVINPARMDDEMGIEGMSWQDFLARDLHAILSDPDVVGVVYLNGWRNSRGATLEGYVAQQAGKKIYEMVALDSEGTSFELEEVETISVAYAAQSVVLGARRFAYGHPLDNFLKICELFNATIGHKLTEPLDIRDVAMLMTQVKIAREYNSPKEDNMVDVCGYALAYSEALNEIEARGGDRNALLSTNAALLQQHTVMGADSER